MNKRLKLIFTCLLCWSVTICVTAQDNPFAFSGEKTTWHEGFDRYDFVMDAAGLEIRPFKAPDGEGFGVAEPAAGQRRCIVIVPKKAAPGNPWSWRGWYWDHQPQAEIELLKRGFCIAYISASATIRPGIQWDAWYSFLIEKHHLSKKPAFIGMSRGGEFSYIWATNHPDKVSCIYADNPGCNPDILRKLGDLARYDVPVLHVCGSIDPILGKNTLAMENMYQQFGGRISVMIKEGYAHHPHSLRDPKPIADFIEQSVQEISERPPAFAGQRFIKTAYYGNVNTYQYVSKEGTYITSRGPFFSGYYHRYEIELNGVEGSTSVIEPKVPAPGNPWIFRAAFVERDALVDQALLARGFYIVTGPVPYNFDGPLLEHWNIVYQYLTSHGFSAKPVIEGAGGAAGEAYAWAIHNPDKVSCIYAENPIIHTNVMMKGPLLDSLSPLAKAGIPILHVCGNMDPGFNDNTGIMDKKYKKMDGKITVIINKGKGHYPLAPEDLQPVVDFITKNAR
jgi:pimeloyl-ACP methyl ester carboxylesterase